MDCETITVKRIDDGETLTVSRKLFDNVLAGSGAFEAIKGDAEVKESSSQADQASQDAPAQSNNRRRK